MLYYNIFKISFALKLEKKTCCLALSYILKIKKNSPNLLTNQDLPIVLILIAMKIAEVRLLSISLI